MTQHVLIVDGVGKSYPTWTSNLARFASWFGAPTKPISEYWAVRGISFELRPGEALALIGENGAGKSTLLKMITGTIRPNEGAISVAGRISAILELGLGFNPEFTGRQNVFQAGGLMGFSHEALEGLMPDIESFAELGDFFDQPLRVYSSGMQARLAFSLATAVRPEVLIVDEVLSVGDSYFQHKSFDRIRRFKEQGSAILFVTHSMGDVRALCNRVILLAKGKMLRDGPPDEVVDYYNAMVADKENAKQAAIEQSRKDNGWTQTRSGNFDVVAKSVELLDAVTQDVIATAKTGQKLILRARVEVRAPLPRLVFGCMLRDRLGHVVWGTNTWHTDQIVRDLKLGQELEFDLEFPCNLGKGSYSFSYALTGDHVHTESNYEWFDNAVVFDVMTIDQNFFVGSSYIPAHITVKPQEVFHG